jgi:predicted NUDIX family NTP pyrophosphohydrolase
MGARIGPVSAGILLYHQSEREISVLLAHPGGPFFARKDAGAWTMPKGLINPDESPEVAAMREFEEELGWRPVGELLPLGEVRLKSGKRVIAFAIASREPRQSLLGRFAPGTFEMEWPRGSGRTVQFPEVDRIAFYSIHDALTAINPSQAPLLDRLRTLCSQQQ